MRSHPLYEIADLVFDVATLLDGPGTVMEGDALLGVQRYSERIGDSLHLGVEALEGGPTHPDAGVEKDVEVGPANVRLGWRIGVIEIERVAGRLVTARRRGECREEQTEAADAKHLHWQDLT